MDLIPKTVNYKEIYIIIILILLFSLVSIVKSQEFNQKYTFEFCDYQLDYNLPTQYHYYNYTDEEKCNYFNISCNILSKNITLLEISVTDAEGYDATNLNNIIESVKINANPNMNSIDGNFSIDCDKIDCCHGVFQFGSLPTQDLQPQEQQLLGRKPRVYVVQYLEPCNEVSKWKRLITIRSYLDQSPSLLHSFKLRPKWEN